MWNIPCILCYTAEKKLASFMVVIPSYSSAADSNQKRKEFLLLQKTSIRSYSHLCPLHTYAFRSCLGLVLHLKIISIFILIIQKWFKHFCYGSFHCKIILFQMSAGSLCNFLGKIKSLCYYHILQDEERRIFQQNHLNFQFSKELTEISA